jgi:hypothetical protein
MGPAAAMTEPTEHTLLGPHSRAPGPLKLLWCGAAASTRGNRSPLSPFAYIHLCPEVVHN